MTRTVVPLGDVGDNFAAGMTGGMGFVYDKNKLFGKKVNSETVVWQIPETDYWKDYLKSLIKKEHVKYTGSEISKNILNNFFENELNNFYKFVLKKCWIN